MVPVYYEVGRGRANPKEKSFEHELDPMCEIEVLEEYLINSSFIQVEMILQVLEYENEQVKDLNEFFQSTAGKFQTDIGKAWAS